MSTKDWSTDLEVGDPASYSRNIQVDERRRKIVRLDQVGVAYVERRRGLGVAYIEMKRAARRDGK